MGHFEFHANVGHIVAMFVDEQGPRGGIKIEQDHLAKVLVGADELPPVVDWKDTEAVLKWLVTRHIDMRCADGVIEEVD